MKLIIGDAISLLPTLGLQFDMAFIDGDKRTYLEAYETVLACLRPGGVILADNTLWDGHVSDSAYDHDQQTLVKHCLATGVLILCTGKATKRIESLQYASKEYTATLQLGATTASYDREHTINMTYPTRHITRELIEQTLPQFMGEIQQIPPEYSACSIGGDRAYKLMRRGEKVELKPKTLRIDELELTHFDPKTMQMSIRVVCGKGTYIRSLARVLQHYEELPG